jgi:hypothetical protein
MQPLVDPWWQHFHRFNPKWSVDPPFDGLVTDRGVWVMTFGGLAPGDQVSISANERRVMMARADASGQAMLTAMTSGAAYCTRCTPMASASLTRLFPRRR